MISLTELVVLS